MLQQNKMKNEQPAAPLDPESLVARIIAELQANPHAQRLLLRALLTNEFLGVPARLDRIVLVEFAASVGRTIRARLERKRRLYEEATGMRPTRVILATASIYSRRAEELRKSGIEVIEPEEPLEECVEESVEPVT